MRAFLLSLAGLLLVGSLAAQAGEPWVSKPPAQWDEKDISRILHSSPWSKSVSAVTTWARTGGEKVEIEPSSRVTIDGRGVRVGSAGSSDDSSDPQNYRAHFFVRWASSNTIRQAKARDLELRRIRPPAQASPAPAQDLYEIELEWDFQAHFPKADERGAAKNSHLRPSLLGVEFNPKRVEYHRDAEGLVTVSFFFEKKTPSGKPLVGEKEDRVDFRWTIGPSAIQARFNPRKMVAREDRDY